MTSHVFLDESKGRDYLLVAASVLSRDVAALRRAMRSHLRSGQRSIHFAKESDITRAAVIATITRSQVAATVYRAPILRDELGAREVCVRAAARDARRADARLMVFDQDDSLLVHDRRWLFQELGPAGVRYEHQHRHGDPLLWIPDAVAWAWRRGGRWRLAVAGTVVREVDTARS
ncbi:hypothetical protein [Cellulomonas rhizosphaerae]|nr:hypothetical protein [Cellulomonas rhizosphaerae]